MVQYLCKVKLIKCIEPDDVYIQYITYHNTLHFQT
jgi:hypothetical protein